MELYLNDITVSDSGFGNNTLQVFALKETGENVFVEIKNFETYFFVGFEDDDISEDYVKTKYMNRFKDEEWFKNVTKMSLIKQKKLIGFSDGKQFPFIKLTFKSVVKSYIVRNKLEEMAGQKPPKDGQTTDLIKYKGMAVYESRSVDPILKFFHSTGVKPSDYFVIKNYDKVIDSKKKSHCMEEYIVDISDVSPCKGDKKPPPLMICSYDIESSGLNPNNDFIFQVSVLFARLGDKLNDGDHASEYHKDGCVICVGKTESIDGTPIIEVNNEMELLEKFKEIIIERGVNILTGYNTFKFDSNFLHVRAKKYGFSDFNKLSFLKTYKCPLQEKTLESAAFGKNELKQIIIPGRVEIDMFMVCKRGQTKLNSYKLNAVCDHYFGGHKDDITYADILEACTGKDPHKLGVIAKYCYQDSGLVLRLLDKVKELYDASAMAKLSMVPLTYVLGRGQQIKCLSLILNRIHGEYVCNFGNSIPIEGEEKKGYKGASVIEAKKGFYEEDPVVTMDFASLYPTIMMRHQLCYTTIVKNDKYLGIEGVHYQDFEVSEGVSATFAYRPGNDSILCEIEKTLWSARKATRKLMKSIDDPFTLSLLDSKQKCEKVTMNSLYGFTGTVNHGMLPLVEIAAAITSTGRKMIEQTKTYAEEKHGANVIYGDTDSVMVIFPGHKKYTDRKEKMEYCFERGETVSAEISKLFGAPILLEFENVYFKYLLVSKKRYAGNSWTKVDKPDYLTMKGLVTVRRDNAPFVGRCASEMIHMLMDLNVTDSRSKVKKHLHDTLLKLEGGDLPVSDLTIRKELKKWEYASATTQGTMARKLIERAEEQKVFREYMKSANETPGGYDDTLLKDVMNKVKEVRNYLGFRYKKAISIKDTIVGINNGAFKNDCYKSENSKVLFDYITNIFDNEENRIVKGLVSAGIGDSFELDTRYSAFAKYDVVEWEAPTLGDRLPYVVIIGKGDVTSRVEDPRMVELGRSIPDTLYYINQQLKNPVIDLLQHVIESPETVFTDFERRAANKKSGRREITSFFTFSKKARKEVS